MESLTLGWDFPRFCQKISAVSDLPSAGWKEFNNFLLFCNFYNQATFMMKMDVPKGHEKPPPFQKMGVNLLTSLAPVERSTLQ